MYIKSITLDGFKSYQKHTEIHGFSRKFNAITGYNGSGKSNVLDSICFILGISKLDNIRAKSMAELISHGGTKATVQIRFDNTDKTVSPFGMEHLDEIVVQRTITAQATGKGCATSYTLNGHAATNSKIHDFFRSIGLNVNNPHFLIMQGRITTVLNMKPEEILGMVEEAAGTKMYDQKKKEAEKTIFLKDAKMQEIDKIFKSNIDPRMDKFREDRKNMVEVTRLTKLKENAQRKYEAFQYHQTVESAQSDAAKMEQVKIEVEELSKKIEAIKEEIAKKDTEQKTYEAIRDDQEIDDKLMEVSREKHKVTAAVELQKNAITDEIKTSQKEQERLSKNLVKDRKNIELKRKELENTRAQNEAEINAYKDDETQVAKFRNDLESLTRGTVANEQGEHVSIETEIQECKTKAAVMEAKVQTAKNRRERLRPRIEKLIEEHDVIAEHNSGIIDDLTEYQTQVDNLTNQINALNFDADSDTVLCDRVTELKRRIDHLKEENLRMLNDQFGGRYALNYQPPPVHGFNAANDIIGYIATLMKLKSGAEQFAVAIEVACAGFFSNLVVRNQDVARILIDSKAFTSRRTMIPVSENARQHIYYPDATMEAKFKEANKVASKYGEIVVKMIDLVEYPDYIDKAFLNQLAGVFVTKSLDCARDVAYHRNVKTRTISWRGDDVKASGVMTGGHSETGNRSTLMEMRPYHERIDEIEKLTKEYKELSGTLSKSDIVRIEYQKLNEDLFEAQRKLGQIKNNMKNSELGVVQKDLEEAKKNLVKVEEEIVVNSQLIAEMNQKVANLESMKSNDKNHQEERKKEIVANLQRAEKNLLMHKDKGELAKRAVMQIAAAVDDLEQTIKNDEAELEKKRIEEQELLAKLPDIETRLAEALGEEAAAKEKIENRKTDFRQNSAKLSKTIRDGDILRKDETKTTHKRDDREREVTRLFESEKANRKHAAALLKKFEWLNDEQVHFNKKGGLYDFESYTSNKGSAEIKDLETRIEDLERRLCMKNVSNLDTCEAKVIDIKNKRDRVKVDFEMLKKTISVLDNRKVDELIRAHKSVNEDFGKIFNCLLPDANAELVPPEGKTVCDGLEVRVSFNGVVKESLHELSGGQRSLVALSLILAMLKFKPAPLYILDEVDAALDLSHTANIGMMIKSHFRNSQFIIVSLKQGMFSNADVLFQTHFADGHSTCTRLVGAALEKAKNDAKLAKQADEMAASEQEERQKSSSAAKAAKSASKTAATDKS